MPRSTVLRTRLDPVTAARVRLHAERAGLSASEWIATVLGRELRRAGAADALAAKTHELALTVGYMLRAVMLGTLGSDATDRVLAEATSAATAETAAELARALDLELPG